MTTMTTAPSTPFWKNPVFVLVCATAMVFLTYGSRQSFGIYLRPMTQDFGWGRESLSLVFGTQALIYGLSAPFVGAIADRWGAIKVLLVAGLLYSGGILLMSQQTTPQGMLLSAGVLGGVGSAGCALSLVLSIASRVAPEKSRTLWLAIITSGGTGGQLVLVPAGQLVLNQHGWMRALVALGLFVLLVLPLTAMIRAAGGEALSDRKGGQSLRQALKEAREHRGFWLLAIGFFTCGFHIAFLVTHLPGEVHLCGLPPTVACPAVFTARSICWKDFFKPATRTRRWA